MRAAVGKGVRVTQAWSELKRVAPRLPPGSLGSSGITRLGGDAFYLRKFLRRGPMVVSATSFLMADVEKYQVTPESALIGLEGQGHN